MRKRLLSTIKTPVPLYFILGSTAYNHTPSLAVGLLFLGIVGYLLRWMQQEKPLLWYTYIYFTQFCISTSIVVLFLVPNTVEVNKYTLISLLVVLWLYTDYDAHTHRLINRIKRAVK